jgi:hypothetical protein
LALTGWVALWAVGALYQLLPGQNTGAAISGALSDAAGDQPGWLAAATNYLAHSIGRHTVFVTALIALQAMIAIAALVNGAPRRASLVAGSTLALGFWAFGQSFGELFSGRATDPNTGPLILLMAVAVSGLSTEHEAVEGAPAYPAELLRRPIPARLSMLSYRR